jgi:flagellar hook capping protein FlgD
VKFARTSLFALLLLSAPTSVFAQYQERWSAGLTFGRTTLSPRNVGDIDGDGIPEVVGYVDNGGLLYVQIRDALTGAVQFTSTTGIQDVYLDGWTVYLLNLDTNPSDLEIMATGAGMVLVIDYAGVVAVPATAAPVTDETLSPAYPNPFDSQMSLTYSLAMPGRAGVEVYDVAGRLVRRLGGDRVAAGEHRVEWDGRDDSGRALEPGMYFYRLNVDGRVSEARKAVRLGP